MVFSIISRDWAPPPGPGRASRLASQCAEPLAEDVALIDVRGLLDHLQLDTRLGLDGIELASQCAEPSFEGVELLDVRGLLDHLHILGHHRLGLGRIELIQPVR